MKKFYVTAAIIALCAFIAVAIYALTEKERYSKEFAQNLFNSSLPPHTKVLEEHYSYGYSFAHLLGSGGYMPVVANMKLSTNLNQEEILNYYKETPLFPFPNSNKKGVELEVYFVGDSKTHKVKDGYYFTAKDDSLKRVSNYKENGEHNLSSEGKTQQYILQISSSFDYIFRLDK